MSRQTYKTDLTDEHWKVLEPLLPRPSRRGRPREHSLREILNAIFYSVDGGIKWRSMPHDLPPWQSVYYYFRLWTRAGNGNNSKRLIEASEAFVYIASIRLMTKRLARA